VNPEALQRVALAVAAETAVDRVLAQVVDGLVAQTAVALARVWLIGTGDICDACPLRADCPDQTRCLHLSASAGAPLDGQADWSRLDGAFRRFPIAVRKIGRIAATGEGILIEDVNRDHDWIADVDWVRRERISSFGGQPLIFKDEILGVLGVTVARSPGFGRLPTTRRSRLRMREHSGRSNCSRSSSSSKTTICAKTSGATPRTASSGTAQRFAT
jgi:GAF domain-containing protein